MLAQTLVACLALTILDALPCPRFSAWWSYHYFLSMALFYFYYEDWFLAPEALLQHVPSSALSVHVCGTGLSRLPKLLSAGGATALATDSSPMAILAMKVSSYSDDTSKYALANQATTSSCSETTTKFDCVIEKGTLAAIPDQKQVPAARKMFEQLSGGGALVSVWLEQSKADALAMLQEVGFIDVKVASERQQEEAGGTLKVVVITAAKAQDA